MKGIRNLRLFKYNCETREVSAGEDSSFLLRNRVFEFLRKKQQDFYSERMADETNSDHVDAWSYHNGLC
jgi:hypothetical protein